MRTLDQIIANLPPERRAKVTAGAQKHLRRLEELKRKAQDVEASSEAQKPTTDAYRQNWSVT